MSGTGADIDEIQSIVDDFIIETDEIILSLENNIVRLEKESDNLDLLNDIFRSAHTIKGASGFLGFDALTNFTHAMEDLLNLFRKGELNVEADSIDVLLDAVDIIKAMLEDVREKRENTVDYEAVINNLKSLRNGKTGSSRPLSTDENSNPHNNSTTAQEPVITEAAEIQEKPIPSGGSKNPENKNQDHTIRVDVKRLDNLLNISGELVLGRNTLMLLTGELMQAVADNTLAEKINQTTAQINFITSELQSAVMQIRMLPINNVFSKFPRQVRNLSRELNKKIDLIVSGEDTEIDKTVIEEINDPLIHLIRNCCDHGIESPETRKISGKSETGTIWLNAGQKGSYILIEITDDGCGIDSAMIAEKVSARGLATKAELAAMSDKEIIQHIFIPGFTTTEKVSDVSGRGVGLDVVRTNIEKLGGIIDIDTDPGCGTKITLKLPLTLAIIQGLIVQSGQDILVIPLVSVLETVKISNQDIYQINKNKVIRLRDSIIPIVDLNDLLGLPSDNFDSGKPYVVLVGLADKRLGLIVNDLLGQEEIVIKSLGKYLNSAPGVSGATILGDGRIRLIVDIIGIFSLISKTP